MEDAEDLDDIQLYLPHVNEDSGSAYEEPSSDADLSPSQDELSRASRASSTTSRLRGRSRSKKPTGRSGDDGDLNYERSSNPQLEEKNSDDALQEATTSKGSGWPANIKLPTRPGTSSRSKRKAERPASQTRTKRLKGVYNNGYRELLNTVILDVASGDIHDEDPPLPGSQIGSSVWTRKEKGAFFKSLSRLGRHDSREISLRIGTKSELEVQEYLQLLRQGMEDRSDVRQLHLGITDIPAAFEISEECESLLEMAGDALATRQEHVEEEQEQAIWGDFWLLTTDTCALIEWQRKEQDEGNAEKPLPAASLFDLKIWLELSQKIFMNSGEPQEANNWESISEHGDAPAIRATAFEDFHALAISITKRLISTALFCAMSRRRATHSISTKHAEVNDDDVEAAIRILGLKDSSLEFWVGSARRHSLNVVDFDEDSGHEFELTYDEVETNLRQTSRRSRSRSLSISHQPGFSKSAPNSVNAGTDRDVPTDSMAESLETDNDSLHNIESDLLSDSSLDDGEATNLSEGQARSRSARRQEARERQAEARRAQEAYIEAYDHDASQVEENRLLELVGPPSPTEIKLEPTEVPDRPTMSRLRAADVDWRDKMEYWSPWEVLHSPVPEEDFGKNRKRMSWKVRRRLREASSRREALVEERQTSSDEEGERTSRSSSDKEVVAAEREEQDGPPDAQMKDEGNAEIYPASQSDRESSQSASPMSDGMLDSPCQRLAQIPQLSDEEIAVGFDYDDY